MNRSLSAFLIVLLALVLLGRPHGATAQGFAPYIDMSITADENIVSIASASRVKAFTLAFLDADGACDIGWGGLGGALPTDMLADGTSILTVVQQLKAAGVTPIFSIGGADGVDPAAYCTSASSLQAVYQTAISRYGITYLDFDIEGAATAEPAQITLRDQALVGLKVANPGLVISYTIPVEPTGLVAGDGLNLLTSAKSDGVALSVVNIMTMDFGSSGTEMGSASIEAAAATEGQIQSAGLNATVGITPMIGQNDSSGEVFTLGDATTVLNFAKSNSYVSRLAMWSMGRDNGNCAGSTSASPSCSGISQGTYAFSEIFEAFSGSGGGGSGGASLNTGTPYNIVNENSGSCVDDTGSGTANGTKVQQWACGNGSYSNQANQQWEFQNGTASGFYEVTNVNAPSEAWNVTGNGTTNGSLIQTWTYAGNPNEEWEAVSLGNGYYKFVGQGSGLCLDTPGASIANGVQLQIYTCNGTAAQAFKLVIP
jgi:Ricin-type beta-trefoil lectin domain-like